MSRDAGEHSPSNDDARPPDDSPEGSDASSDVLGATVSEAVSLGGSAPPPSSLRDRILARARESRFSFIRHSEGIWLPDADSPVAIKELYRDSADRLATRLVRVLAGQRVPRAPMSGLRTCYLVEGQLRAQAWDEPCDSGDTIVAGEAGEELVATGDALLLELTRGEAFDAWDALDGLGQETPSLPAVVSRSRAQEWRSYAAGIKVTSLGGTTNADSFLSLRIAPGATLADHEHNGVEELYVLTGSCVVEGRTLAPGDYHRATPGSVHSETRSGNDGCLLLVSLRDRPAPSQPSR